MKKYTIKNFVISPNIFSIKSYNNATASSDMPGILNVVFIKQLYIKTILKKTVFIYIIIIFFLILWSFKKHIIHNTEII